MAYYFYIDKLLFPIAPQKLQVKINSQNKTVTLINDGEINILKKADLTDIEFDALLPQTEYPFSTYKNGFKPAEYYLNELERLKTSLKPFQFIVVRTLPSGKMLFNTNMKVSLEDYKIIDDVKNGFDISVSVKLKQYRDYGTKTCKVTPDNKGTSKPNSSANTDKITIGCDVIVNGVLHRDSYGNGPGQSRINYRGKINYINLHGTHPYHVTNPSGGWLGWVLKSAVRRV